MLADSFAWKNVDDTVIIVTIFITGTNQVCLIPDYIEWGDNFLNFVGFSKGYDQNGDRVSKNDESCHIYINAIVILITCKWQVKMRLDISLATYIQLI